MKSPALLLAVLTLAGCATATTIPISRDTVMITSRASPACGMEGAQRIAVRQAATETIRRGYDRFVIVDAALRSEVSVVGHTPVTAYTTASATATGYGGFATAQGTAVTTYTGGQPIYGGSHRQGLMVKMFKDDDPAGSNANSARQELGPKWQELVANDSVTCLD